ncbi:MAG TPA: AarF/ABC1/UbiB kinase family protein [Acidimicrobiales bacterium]|nr:AarF/ABC1/UbiB kinase family protein [Acidimicrobiales bacterium]
MTSAYHRRQRRIAEVLVRYEMGHLLEVLGLEHFASLERRLLRRGSAPTRPESLRRALEELGPTFIKLGQVLSTRADLLPPSFEVELAKLQDETIPVATDAIEEAVSTELGGPPREVFANFEPEPLAAASIGQVHAATLRDGTEVVVKVRRPGATEEVELDLEILLNLAARATQRWKEAERYDLNGLARDFANQLRAELDYLQEARNAQVFAANFASDPRVHIPSVYPELTTSRVITLERIRGTKITDLAALDAAGMDRPALAERLASTVAQMVLVDGVYHGDPHPGNFFVEPDGRIGIVDFGRVGRIDDDLRSRLSKLLTALIRKDPDRLTTALLALREPGAPIEHARMRQDLSELLSQYSGRAIHDMPIGAGITEVLNIVRRHNLIVSGDLALLFAVLFMDESILDQLAPDFRFDDALKPYIERHLASSLSPAALAHRAERFGMEVAELTGELPGQLHRLLERIGNGQFEVHLRTSELQPLVGRIERLANRVAISILAAAAIDGLSELAAHDHSARGWRRPALAAGIGVVTSLTAYEGWRRSPIAALRHRLRSPS